MLFFRFSCLIVLIIFSFLILGLFVSVSIFCFQTFGKQHSTSTAQKTLYNFDVVSFQTPGARFHFSFVCPFHNICFGNISVPKSNFFFSYFHMVFKWTLFSTERVHRMGDSCRMSFYWLWLTLFECHNIFIFFRFNLFVLKRLMQQNYNSHL